MIRVTSQGFRKSKRYNMSKTHRKCRAIWEIHDRIQDLEEILSMICSSAEVI